ncbi:MAG: PqqD family protein [Planctomycetota bacterium]
MIRLTDSVERINHPFQMIEGDTIIVNPKDRLMHQLNDVGSRVWELIARKQAVTDLVNAITNEYDIEPPEAGADIIQLLEKMSELKLIKVSNG